MTALDNTNTSSHSSPSAYTRSGNKRSNDVATRATRKKFVQEAEQVDTVTDSGATPGELAEGPMSPTGPFSQSNSLARDDDYPRSAGISGSVDQSDSSAKADENNGSSPQNVNKGKEKSRASSTVLAPILNKPGIAQSQDPPPSGTGTTGSESEAAGIPGVQIDSGMDSANRSADKGTNGPENQAVDGAATVVKANPHAAAVAIRNPSWIPKDVMKRLATIASRDNPTKFRFALSKIPHHLTVFGGHDGSYLCYKQRPLTVLFLGRIRSTRFMEDGGPARCASVMFKFLSDLDLRVARSLINEKAKPALPPTKIYWAGQRTTHRDRTSGMTEVRWFSDLYDGTEEIKAKHLMVKLDLDLHLNDIALFECQIQRYVKGDYRRVAWKTWEVSFQLQSLIKVYSAPPSAPDQDESDVEVSIKRDDTDDEVEPY
ncbi:hypothetical protein NM688_g13 [Phlebia brevispora]|uniref:Uncharacterized protein n=1 Tax=Phlebia brevispora TaxID=194682 RepID=A0ACC1TFD9_9APHY|nr:hypothetical protein NM688_g13 [Phlebia brevispora]